MILLTAATGPTGLHVLKHLVARGATVRAFVSKPASADKAMTAGAAATFVGDIHRAEDIGKAMAGAEQVYHIAPRFDDEIGIGRAMIAAAETARVRQFVYHSVIHSQVDGLVHHRDKRIVEGLLMESSLPYTILQPTMYMQSTTRDWAEIAKTGEFRLPQARDKKMSLVDLEDVGEAAARVTLEDGWIGGCFELCNGELLTRDEMARAMSQALDKPVRAVVRDTDEWERHVRAQGVFRDEQVARLRIMQEHYTRYGLSGGNGRVLELVLGRRPTPYAAFLARVARG
jgi:uncharacterized protein YbjT (DUF2867 family)